jgi:hypothetical protein
MEDDIRSMMTDIVGKDDIEDCLLPLRKLQIGSRKENKQLHSSVTGVVEAESSVFEILTIP